MSPADDDEDSDAEITAATGEGDEEVMARIEALMADLKTQGHSSRTRPQEMSARRSSCPLDARGVDSPRPRIPRPPLHVGACPSL